MPAGWIGAGAAIYGATQGGKGGGGGGGSGLTPGALGAVDSNWYENNFTGQGLLSGQYGGPYGQYSVAGVGNQGAANTYNQQQGIDYNPYLNAANQAGQQYGQLAGYAGNVAQNLFNQGNYATGQQQQLGQAGNQLWQTAQDPQNALRNQLQQQTLDRANVTNSMYGLGSSGAGAGVANQALNNFNIDWQNQQLGRQAQGLQGMISANQAGGQLGTLGNASYQAGLGTYGQVPGYTQQAAQTPLNAQQYVAGMPAQNANQYANNISQTLTPYYAQQNQQIPYLFQGAGAQSQAFNNNLALQRFNAQQQQGAFNALGQAAGGVDWSRLGSIFNQQPQGSYIDQGPSYDAYDQQGANWWGGP